MTEVSFLKVHGKSQSRVHPARCLPLDVRFFCFAGLFTIQNYRLQLEGLVGDRAKPNWWLLLLL